jgi:hypothetical protein
MSKRKAAHIDRAFELVSLGRSSYASKSAISKLLAHIEKDGLPETYSRAEQYRARKEICRKREGEYGPLVVDTQLPLEGGEPQKFSIQNVFAFLQHNCMHSEHYAKIMQMALSRYPCSPSSPWRLILYQDGVDPSDGLAKNHSRKSAVYYWSFVEFGMQALAKEEVWGVVTVARYSEYSKLAGKGASLFEAVLDHIFGEVHHLRRTGCSLKFPSGERALLLAEPSVLLCDMPALAECLCCKGHPGTICCPGCANATQENTKAAVALHALTDAAVSISNTDWKAFTKHSNESIRHVVQKLNDHHQMLIDGTLTKDKFAELEQVLGWNWNPSNIILNDRFGLKVASMLMFDGAHVYVHDGLADTELGQMMKAFHTHRSPTSFKELGEYVDSFTFPKNSPSLKHLFSASANRNNAKNGSFSCTGSEFLTLAPVLSRYLQQVVRHREQFVANVDSMLAVLDVVAMLQSVKTGTVDPADLERAIVKHLQLYKTCYGSESFRPKHHYALHLPYMLRHHGFLLMTFTHERKHRLVTRYTRDRKNLKSWDAGSIEEITCHQLWELSQPFWGVCKSAQARGSILIPLREMFPDVPAESITILNGIKGNGGAINCGDVVSCVVDGHIQLGELMVAVGIRRANAYESYCVVSLWQLHPESADVVWPKYAVSRENVKVLSLQYLDTVFTHSMSADRSSCVVYLPLEVRAQ